MKKKSIPVAGGILLTGITVFYELLLHLWSGSSFAPAQLLPTVLFGLSFGSLLAAIACLLPGKHTQKWFSAAAALMLAVIFMTEYFLNESFRSFMTPKVIAGGAGGVANGFMDVVITLILTNWWKILLVLLPIVLFILFVQPRKDKWQHAAVFAAIAAAACLLACGSLYWLTGSLGSITNRFNFDGSVRSNGLSVSLVLEISGLGEAAQQDSFTEVSVPLPILPTQPEEEEAEEEPTEPPVPQVLDGVDFADMASKSGPPTSNLLEYINSQTPGMTNKYTGLLAGKNLIFISAEAFTAEVIDPELTPTLYRMATKGIHFKEFYQPVWNGGTSGGEMANLSGIVPRPSGGMKGFTDQKPFFTIGHQLQREGYFSRAYHNNTGSFYDRYMTHENLGYEKFIAMFSGMEEGVENVWPQSDLQMIDFTVPQYIDHQPFSVYYMSVSGHSLYSLDGNAQARKNYDKVKDLDYSEPVKCYLAAQLELEYAMESLVRQLEEKGIADDTVIAIAADHYPYGLDKGSAWNNSQNYDCELFGVTEQEYNNFIRDHSAAIIWSGCLEGMNLTVETPAYSLDLLPTLDNLFGLDYDSRMLVGRDVFSDGMPLVLWPDHSWVTEAGQYNGLTGVFTPRDGIAVSDEYINSVSAIVSNKINYSHTALSNYFFRYLGKQLGYIS